MNFLSGTNCTNCSHIFFPELRVVKTVALGMILGVFILFGVVGNILVILSVVCHRHLRTVTHYFIVNLAVADLLLSSTVLPFSAVFEILDRWVFGRAFCNVWAAVDVLCCTASIMSLCVISVDRYIGVSYPLRYPSIMTKRRALLAVMLLWVLSIIISIGPLFGWKEPEPEDESICKITEEPGYAIFSAVGSFYLPLTIILVMYCRVYVVAHRESQGLREGHKTEKSDSEQVILRIHRGNTTALEEESLRSRTHFALRLLKFSREKKAAKTLGIVVGCFVLCWLPFFLVLPIGSIFPAYRPSDTVFKITFWLGYFNSCINPIIYPCSNQEFKKAFQSLLGVHCHSQGLTLSLDTRLSTIFLFYLNARIIVDFCREMFISSFNSRDCFISICVTPAAETPKPRHALSPLHFKAEVMFFRIANITVVPPKCSNDINGQSLEFYF
uniref:Alpha-1A adrenergic receptor n=1 Tax=Xiphophorus couchianus TaxID=32473 RepID=A0A3B5MNK7_9TELE